MRSDLAIRDRAFKNCCQMTFSDLGLSPALIEACGFSEPTSIQREAIPPVLEGRDVLGIARTGSGKTAGYVLPILQRLQAAAISEHREPVVLVLVPTRELADQVSHVVKKYLVVLGAGLRCCAVFGGVSINPQMQALGKVDLLVATPGRLLDLVRKNAVCLSSVATLVLDEADKMLNLGFKEEIDQILALLPPRERRQTLLFSATASPELTSQLRDPVVVEIVEEEKKGELIRQIAYAVTEERKGPLLRYLIKHGNLQQVLVFVSSTLAADRVLNKLSKNGISAAVVHSKVSQGARRESLASFKSGETRVLVATDLLSRGIDIQELPCVINYELPRSPKDYIHRIGRTGRADSPGDAISLITPDERHHFKIIQKKMGERVELIESAEVNLQDY
ncbi:MAG: ATP-dependent RNA helicase RhlE [Akkermansiaceae bacterium]